ncbi:MAG: hypothetical protein K6E34_07075 [Lachnospiraceae bacterium]|nr:hypothetical protein [Lachnospiraceae bacterium]
MSYIENMLGIKGKGEIDYRHSINVFMGNTYDLFLRIDLSGITINNDLTISLHFERIAVDSHIRLTARIIPDGDDKKMQYGSVFLNSNIRIVFEYVKGSGSLNLDNCDALAKTLIERSALSLTKEQLTGINAIEFKVSLRSIPLEMQLTVDHDDFEKNYEDDLEYFLAEGTDFNVRITNTGDQIERDIQVVSLPPVELDIVPDLAAPDIFKEGICFQDLRPGDSFNTGFQLKISDRFSLPEEVLYLAAIQNCVHVRTASSGYNYCELYMYPLFSEGHEKQYDLTAEDLFDCPPEEVLDSYCPGRKMFEYRSEPDTVSLNSIKNHPVFRDERQFIYFRSYDRSGQFTTHKEVKPGDVLEVIVFFHNPLRKKAYMKAYYALILPVWLPAKKRDR